MRYRLVFEEGFYTIWVIICCRWPERWVRAWELLSLFYCGTVIRVAIQSIAMGIRCRGVQWLWVRATVVLSTSLTSYFMFELLMCGHFYLFISRCLLNGLNLFGLVGSSTGLSDLRWIVNFRVQANLMARFC